MDREGAQLQFRRVVDGDETRCPILTAQLACRHWSTVLASAPMATPC